MELTKRRTISLAKGAVKQFWAIRKKQASKQKASGKSDQGSRGAATGGAQMDGVIDAFCDLASLSGVPEQSVFRKSRFLELPGYFRPTKQWDLLVVHDGVLLAALEAKSQVGPSFGNNVNNRAEEALGNALDLWTAFKYRAYGRAVRPWLGYFFLLEDCPESRKPRTTREPHFEVMKEFRGASYAKRYEILCQRLIFERQYDASAFLMSQKSDGITGKFSEPCPELSFHRFASSFVAHLKGNMQ
ncbi:PaeR7I family type II restriction endonuclease [bacterium]|nr:PaeR7I family type II restriction endonuclease [bacterium]